MAVRSADNIRKLELEVKLLTNEYKKVRKKPKVYMERFGKIID